MPVKRIDKADLEQDVFCLRYLRAFEEVKVFVQIRLHAKSAIHARESTKREGSTRSDVGKRVWIVERYRIHRKRNVAAGIKHRVGDRIPVTARPGAAQERNTRNLVEPDTTGKSGNATCATYCNGLTALITLNAADGPPSNNTVQNSTRVQEAFSLSHWQFVDVANHEVLRKVLVADGLVASQIEGILASTALVQRGKEW